MTPEPIPTTTAALLLAIKQRLFDENLFTESSCFLTLHPEALVFPSGDMFVTITPGRQSVDDRMRTGAGRVVMLIEGDFLITLWVRMALDALPREDSWLTDSIYGALPKAHAIVNALELYQPLDASGNQLLAQGVKLRGIDSYTREYDGVGYGAVSLSWSWEYQLLLNPQE